MRTNIEINDDLLNKAFAVTGLKTKKAVVDESLRRLVHCSQQLEAINALKGLAEWEGDIKSLRKDRELPQ